ncbi:MAG: hypothetical protein ACLPTJ_08025 [Solirubrobacteraceae bacterium]
MTTSIANQQRRTLGSHADVSLIPRARKYFASDSRRIVLLAGASAAIGIAVYCNWHPRPFLLLAVVLSLAYWVLGQGFGGIFAGGATDPNAGPLFVLLAYAMYALIPFDSRADSPGALTARSQSA